MKLEEKLYDKLIEASKEAQDKVGYFPGYFLDMLVENGAVGASKILVSDKEYTSGFTKLWEYRRLDLSVEAIILSGPWIELFSEIDIANAERKLKEVEFSFEKYEVKVDETESQEQMPWTDQELAYAITTYFQMLATESRHEEFNKSEFRRNLQKDFLPDRSDKSIEFRFQNISNVLQDMGLKWIKGYKPATNVGKNVGARIRSLILEHHIQPEVFEPTTSRGTLDDRVSQLLEFGISDKPDGIEEPEKSESTTSKYKTSPKVKAWVLQLAGGICEFCDEESPFIKENGEKFLELHHVVHLAQKGSDTAENAVAVCPNCHRAFHYSHEKEELTNTLLSKVARLTS